MNNKLSGIAFICVGAALIAVFRGQSFGIGAGIVFIALGALQMYRGLRK